MCIFTYDNCIQFYDLPADPNGEPSIYWIGDMSDPFVPLPRSRLLLNIVEERERLDCFLDKLQTMYTPETR